MSAPSPSPSPSTLVVTTTADGTTNHVSDSTSTSTSRAPLGHVRVRDRDRDRDRDRGRRPTRTSTPTPWFHLRRHASSRSSSPMQGVGMGMGMGLGLSVGFTAGFGFGFAWDWDSHDLVFLDWLRRMDPAFLDADLPGAWPSYPSSGHSPPADSSDSDPTPHAQSLEAPRHGDSCTLSLDRLPDDLLLSLLDHLPRDAYLNLALASHLFFRLAHDPTAMARALRRWLGCIPRTSTSHAPLSLSTHLAGSYTGFALDRCTNQFEPYPMHVSLPPCPTTSPAAYRHLLSSTASHGEGHCHWPSLGNATTRLTGISHAPWSPNDRHAVAAAFMRDRHADALTWTELDLLSPVPPPSTGPGAAATHVNQIALPNTYQAVALGPWLLGTFDPAQSQLSRGAFVLLATDALPIPRPLGPSPSIAARYSLRHGSTLLLRGLLANTHAPLALPNVTLRLTYHDPPLPALPFRTVLRRPPLLPGPVRWTGSIAVTPGVGTGASPDDDHGHGQGVMSSSGILLTGDKADDSDVWTHGIALDVAGCISAAAPPTAAPGDASEEWHLYASLDHWQAQHDRAEARRRRLGKAKGPQGAQSGGGHVSEWSRTYAPLLDRITLRVLPSLADEHGGKAVRTRVVGWWKYPTLSCFFAEVEHVEHGVAATTSAGKGKAKARLDQKVVVDPMGLGALGL